MSVPIDRRLMSGSLRYGRARCQFRSPPRPRCWVPRGIVKRVWLIVHDLKEAVRFSRDQFAVLAAFLNHI